jgi:UPF0755 protein
LNTPVKLAFNNQEKVQDLFVRIASQIEPDTTKLNEIFTNDTFLQENGLNKDNVMSFFIPNSYEFYWNISPEEFAEKLTKEYKRFWNDGRLDERKALRSLEKQIVENLSLLGFTPTDRSRLGIAEVRKLSKLEALREKYKD